MWVHGVLGWHRGFLHAWVLIECATQSCAGAFYMRLVGKAVDVYQYLEPLYNDYRKVRCREKDGSFALSHMDEVGEVEVRRWKAVKSRGAEASGQICGEAVGSLAHECSIWSSSVAWPGEQGDARAVTPSRGVYAKGTWEHS